ncbi:amidohydrolase family protein [uncultured Treponema sp.]|uniref:amidohydrolase family protein n=1 Tax=uncultured Treponema sp. TaxID=162155 RepID=UPI0025F7C27E|nr:amidohydrolase family protein [uncultured Treponema sp.]
MEKAALVKNIKASKGECPADLVIKNCQFVNVFSSQITRTDIYHLYDRGAIAPGYRADIVLVNNLKDFETKKVFIKGELVAEGWSHCDYDCLISDKMLFILLFSIDK